MTPNELADAMQGVISVLNVHHEEDCLFIANEAQYMLRKLQAENDAWQAKYEADYAKAFENGYAIGLSHGKDLVNNGEI